MLCSVIDHLSGGGNHVIFDLIMSPSEKGPTLKGNNVPLERFFFFCVGQFSQGKYIGSKQEVTEVVSLVQNSWKCTKCILST